jgi:16S rRNA (adenine1518-N6/adenine1519-N6)-dimethyltransferase
MFRDPRPLLARHGLTAKKAFSQNFLVSRHVVEAMASFAHGTVLEVGPGAGTLTAALAERADQVIAIERDPAMVALLREEYDWDNVDIIEGDALCVDLPPFDACISSVPYAISSPLLFRLLPFPFEELVLLLQKEVCHKLLMEGSPSRLSMMAYSYADTYPVRKVPPTAFYPPPAVDSMVVRLVPHRKVCVDTWYEKTVTALFTHKRKTVRNALIDGREMFNKEKDEIRAIADGAPYAQERITTLSDFQLREIADRLAEAWREGG